jgi:hypothetical protein
LRESDVAASSTWKQIYSDEARKKVDKLAAMSIKLKAMQENHAQERSAGGIKAMNMHTAVRIENKAKGATTSAAAAAGKPGPYAPQMNKLAKLKQDAKSVSVARQSAVVSWSG